MKKIIPLLLLGCFFFNFSYAQIAEGKPKEKRTNSNGKKYALKLSLNSFLYDDKEYLSFAIERSVARRKSYQFEWGIKIFDGTTLSNYDFSTGETISVPRIANGVFFKFSSRLYSSGMQPRHFKMDPSVFRGFYIEPELVIGFYKRNVSNRAAFSTPFSSVPPPLNASLFVLESVNYQGVMVNFGRQGVINNMALVDVSLGIGVVKDNLEPVKSERNYKERFKHGNLSKANGGITLAIQGTIKFGGIF